MIKKGQDDQKLINLIDRKTAISPEINTFDGYTKSRIFQNLHV